MSKEEMVKGLRKTSDNALDEVGDNVECATLLMRKLRNLVAESGEYSEIVAIAKELKETAHQIELDAWTAQVAEWKISSISKEEVPHIDMISVRKTQI